jgi:hypothetical protein
MTSASNSGILRPFTAREMIEEATSRCGIKAVQLTSEIVEKSLDQLNIMFPAMLNRGVQLWKRQRVILPCYLNTARVNLPEGTSLVSRLTRRSLARLTGGIPFSRNSLGVDDGVAALAFDDDFDTSCNQIALNGSVGMVFPQAVQVTTVGVKFNIAMQLDLFVEYSNDGLVWTAIGGVTGDTTVGQWVWFDLDGTPQALQWRVRSVSNVTLDVQEVFFGRMPSEIPIDPWNVDEYNSMPDKTSGGQVVNWYQQRDLDGPYLLVWPVPNGLAKYDQLVAWVHEYLDTVASPTQDLDLPRRWFDAATSMLARRLCRSLPEADFKRYEMLRGEEQEAIELAEAEERDPAPSNYDLGLEAYTA